LELQLRPNLSHRPPNHDFAKGIGTEDAAHWQARISGFDSFMLYF
jgi:hypothetical protein